MGLSEGEEAGSCRVVIPARADSTRRVCRIRDVLGSPFRESSHLSDSPRRRPPRTSLALKREVKTRLLKGFRSRIGPSTKPRVCVARCLRRRERSWRSASRGDLERRSLSSAREVLWERIGDGA